MDTTIGCTSRPYNMLSYNEAYSRIAAAGYTEVAVFANEGQMPVRSDSSESEVAAVRAAASAAGVKPTMLLGKTKLGEGIEPAFDDYRRLIDNAAGLGVRYLLDLGTGDEERFEVYFALMRRAAPLAAAAGINITMKPHGGISLTTENLVAAHAQVGHPAFAICCDPGNIIYYTNGDSRPESDIDEVAPLASTAIIKDCTVVNGKPDVMITAGDGLVDFPVILAGLDRAGFSGPCYVECVAGEDGAAIDRDLAFVLGYIKGIQAAI